MKGIFSVLVENKDGVLSQISVFREEASTTDSLAVARRNASISSMTIRYTPPATTHCR